MGLSDWSTVAGVFKTGFGHNNVMLILFFCVFTNIYVFESNHNSDANNRVNYIARCQIG